MVLGKALLSGSDDVKSHSSSSGALLAGCVAGAGAKSKSDEPAGAAVFPPWNGLALRGLADTNDANGSTGGGVAVVCCCCCWAWATGVEDWDGTGDELSDDRMS